MKRVFIIVEGQTEEEFVKSVLREYLINHGIYDITPIIIHTSKGHKGGFIDYIHLRNDIQRLNKSQSNVLVTTFVDFFSIPKNLPGYKVAMAKPDCGKKVEALENSIKNDIGCLNNNTLLPYIQLHEFEALLFSSIDGFKEQWNSEPKVIKAIEKVIAKYYNPEDINDNKNTAPSKRLETIIPNYNKIVDGNFIALSTGIDTILEKCPRFKNWINSIINLSNI